jgi:uncharacterized repeat protein (TIGR03803 family)
MRPSCIPFTCVLLLLLFSETTFTFAQARGRVLYPLSPYPGCGDSLTALIAERNGNLYGTASTGGSANNGCVFGLSPSRTGWQETIIYSFDGTDGSGPRGALVFDRAGNLYGTAGGGAYDAGVAFELSLSADGGWAEGVLHNFGNGEDGAGPECNLILDTQGNLYGTTNRGGPHEVGTVFKLSPSGGDWAETILYSFSSGINGPGGSFPTGGLVMDREGRLYGVTTYGGEYGGGTVFQLTPSESGSYSEKIIHSFDGTDGSNPNSLAMDQSGNLYATTEFGGYGFGTVTELIKQPDGGWGENVLHMMNSDDGAYVVGPAAFDSEGNLYAAAELGAINGMGSIFMLAPTPSGPWTETVLHRFDFQFPDGEDGARPYAGVLVGHEKVFGTTSQGGIYNGGIVFEGTPPANSSLANPSAEP